jgi:RNA polymerase sigma factor (sigma-70 family)
MKFKKTPTGKRFKITKDGNNMMIYEMVFDNGDKVVYETGKVTIYYAQGRTIIQYDENITQQWIKQLHSFDDAEVDSNLNEIRCETRGMRKEREAKKRKWLKENPFCNLENNPYIPMTKLLNIDSCSNDDFINDHSKIEFEAIKYQEKIESSPNQNDELKIRVRNFISTLPKKQQTLYRMVYIDGLKQSEICKKLGLSKSTISEQCKKLEQIIMHKFKNNRITEHKKDLCLLSYEEEK